MEAAIGRRKYIRFKQKPCASRGRKTGKWNVVRWCRNSICFPPGGSRRKQVLPVTLGEVRERGGWGGRGWSWVEGRFVVGAFLDNQLQK